MKKLEKLKSKTINKKSLAKVLGALMAPDYTVYNTQCSTSSGGQSIDCDDCKKDK
ncbi:hypothetical protein QGN23_01245 [Chryseobacterium gotjawalense]|uniref:Bacteriocin n=1 Tax=Chryseobacterium gotjawalense TaxID=3042315 RepID=A0ABY8RD54_9FLAO|nr:hypothetical protein [Chryseobacterium sp. wdc7]WHF51917.1 hypothetical protein QGN23_01245 [Chryseobacterium sp. wdc7]